MSDDDDMGYQVDWRVTVGHLREDQRGVVEDAFNAAMEALSDRVNDTVTDPFVGTERRYVGPYLEYDKRVGVRDILVFPATMTPEAVKQISDLLPADTLIVLREEGQQIESLDANAMREHGWVRAVSDPYDVGYRDGESSRDMDWIMAIKQDVSWWPDEVEPTTDLVVNLLERLGPTENKPIRAREHPGSLLRVEGGVLDLAIDGQFYRCENNVWTRAVEPGNENTEWEPCAPPLPGF